MLRYITEEEQHSIQTHCTKWSCRTIKHSKKTNEVGKSKFCQLFWFISRGFFDQGALNKFGYSGALVCRTKFLWIFLKNVYFVHFRLADRPKISSVRFHRIKFSRIEDLCRIQRIFIFN